MSRQRSSQVANVVRHAQAANDIRRDVAVVKAGQEFRRDAAKAMVSGTRLVAEIQSARRRLA